MNKLEKVYILLDSGTLDDENYLNVIAVSTDKSEIKRFMDKYIQVVKKEIDFNNLEISKDGIDDGYVVEEDEDRFSLYLNGEYNSFHIDISINEKELLKEKDLVQGFEL